MLQSKNLLSNRYSSNSRLLLKLPTKILPTLRSLEKEIQKNTNYLIAYQKCPVCDFKKSTIVSEISRYNLPMEIQVCDFCGLIFNVGHFSREFMLKYYRNYFYLIRRPGSKTKKFQSHIRPNSNAWKRKSFIKKCLGKKYTKVQTVVEIGCGDGGNLFPFYSDEITAIGCDFDEGAINQGKSNGLELYLGDMNCLIEKGIKADLLLLPHVLAHIADVNEFLRQILKIVKIDGFLYIESDGIFAENALGEIKNTNLLWYFQFDFTMCFELRTLSYLLIKNGFNIEYCDESIKCISSPPQNLNNCLKNSKSRIVDNNGEVLRRIIEIENNYLKKHLFVKYIRKIRSIFNLIKNTTIFSFIDYYYSFKK